MHNILLIQMFLVLPPLLFQARSPEQDLRSILIESIKKNDLDVSRTRDDMQPFHFSHVCTLKDYQGRSVYVGDYKSVLIGMDSPRGINYIMFFDSKFNYLSKVHYSIADRIQCRDKKVYLSNTKEHYPQYIRVINTDQGFQNLTLYSEKILPSAKSPNLLFPQ